MALPRSLCHVGRLRVCPALQFARYRSSDAAMAPRSKPEQSIRVRMKDFTEIPADMGLLPNTFIMPTGKNLPSIITSPGRRIRLEMQRVKHRLIDWRERWNQFLSAASLLACRLMTKTKIRLREPRAEAKRLHSDMYTAFAERDLETLRIICGEGLLQSFKKRLMSRGKLCMQWKLHKYVRPVKIVSNKAGMVAGTDMSRRQAVVRIHSIQSLTQLLPDGSPVKGTGDPKEVLEYLVIEKKKMGDQELPWFIWGTTDESRGYFGLLRDHYFA